jgi:hypothetical protein
VYIKLTQVETRKNVLESEINNNFKLQKQQLEKQLENISEERSRVDIESIKAREGQLKETIQNAVKRIGGTLN